MTHLSENAFAQLEGWSALEVAGPDAGKFLQNFCTNDVLKLADGQSCEAMFTDVKAHVIAYGWVARHDAGRYTVLLSSPRVEQLLAHLDRYLIREQVELSIAPGDTVLLTSQNAESPGLTPIAVAAYGEGATAWFGLRDACDKLSAVLQAHGADPLSPDAFAAWRIGLGLPLDGVDVDERNLPQEVDRNEAAISFTKGCYLGQEPVARIDALGRVNWLLRGLDVEGPPPAHGAELASSEGKPAGRVTSSAATETGAVALAYVRREHAEPGVRLTVAGASATVRG